MFIKFEKNNYIPEALVKAVKKHQVIMENENDMTELENGKSENELFEMYFFDYLFKFSHRMIKED